MNNFLSIENLSVEKIKSVIKLAKEIKKNRYADDFKPLKKQTWVMIFKKASTRTRISFEIGINELGGQALFLSNNDIQLGRGEPIKDTARVIAKMAHGAIIRTFDQKEIEEFAQFSNIPTINALTDEEHPCQIISDLLTIEEHFGEWKNKKIVFMGDGLCNMAISYMWLAKHLQLDLCICAPKKYQVNEKFLQKINEHGDFVSLEESPQKAVINADIIYTDVWVSMGLESETENRLKEFKNYQINSKLLKSTKNKECIVMHCLPAYRGKEITENVLEKYAEIIFSQAENRLHAQKAIMTQIAKKTLNG